MLEQRWYYCMKEENWYGEKTSEEGVDHKTYTEEKVIA